MEGDLMTHKASLREFNSLVASLALPRGSVGRRSEVNFRLCCQLFAAMVVREVDCLWFKFD